MYCLKIKWCKKIFQNFFFKNFPEKTFRAKLLGKTFWKKFPEKLSGKNFPEKTFWKKLSRKKLSGKTFRLNLPTLFIRKKIWKAFPKNFPNIFLYCFSEKLFWKLSKKLYRKTFHPKFQDKHALKLPWKLFWKNSPDSRVKLLPTLVTKWLERCQTCSASPWTAFMFGQKLESDHGWIAVCTNEWCYKYIHMRIPVLVVERMRSRFRLAPTPGLTPTWTMPMYCSTPC